MGAGDEDLTVGSRLKREQCKRTKHDSHFSKWQVLIGPTDWEDYYLGKEGAARYRVHNLPSVTDPGLYELGIAAARSGLGREVSKIDSDGIVVVYLGQADNVRTRLQQYGRSGAHLGNSYSTGSPNEFLEKGYGLFENIFSSGHSIVFRWAPTVTCHEKRHFACKLCKYTYFLIKPIQNVNQMKTKKDAEKMESNLLDIFDYAWNKGGNGVRRPNDILLKLTKSDSSTRKLTNMYKKLIPFTQKRVGIKIEGTKPLTPEKNKSESIYDEEKLNFLPGIFKTGRSRPKLISVSDNYVTEEPGPICGVLLSDGDSCRKSPVPGRKRCEEHKGKKVYGFVLESRTGGQSNDVPDTVPSQTWFVTCGVVLQNGDLCDRAPVPGRKRCEEHKGMRVKLRVPTTDCVVVV
ncbi:hypothetical protein ACFE04_013686 [Oxalis oulophora]